MTNTHSNETSQSNSLDILTPEETARLNELRGIPYNPITAMDGPRDKYFKQGDYNLPFTD